MEGQLSRLDGGSWVDRAAVWPVTAWAEDGGLVGYMLSVRHWIPVRNDLPYCQTLDPGSERIALL